MLKINVLFYFKNNSQPKISFNLESNHFDNYRPAPRVNISKTLDNSHEHKNDGYWKCKGCKKPLCQFEGFDHKNDGYWKYKGCKKPLCQFPGFDHKNNGYHRCKGFGNALCE